MAWNNNNKNTTPIPAQIPNNGVKSKITVKRKLKALCFFIIMERKNKTYITNHITNKVNKVTFTGSGLAMPIKLSPTSLASNNRLGKYGYKRNPAAKEKPIKTSQKNFLCEKYKYQSPVHNMVAAGNTILP